MEKVISILFSKIYVQVAKKNYFLFFYSDYFDIFNQNNYYIIN